MNPYYQDDLVTLYHGDCRDVLGETPPESVDLLLTDPPYGMNWQAKGKAAQGSVAGDGARQGVRLVRQMLAEVSPLLHGEAHLLMFCHWESWPDFYDALSPYAGIRNALIWHKATGGMGNVRTNYLRDYEVILYAARGKRPILGDGAFSNVLSGFGRVVGGRAHPTEKPGALLRHLIRRHSPADGLVLDPFAGSGSALLAARAEGRRSLGVEIDEHYCEIAAERLSTETMHEKENGRLWTAKSETATSAPNARAATTSTTSPNGGPAFSTPSRSTAQGAASSAAASGAPNFRDDPVTEVSHDG